MVITVEQIIQAVGSGVVAMVAYLIKHYLGSFRKDLSGVKKDFAKIEGHLMALQAEIRSNTVELARTTSEIKAVWRFIDNAPSRASDRNGEYK